MRPVSKGQCLCWADVAVDTGTHAWRMRKEMEQAFVP
jgi:predicted homoserine dehydrogenase-like protein